MSSVIVGGIGRKQREGVLLDMCAVTVDASGRVGVQERFAIGSK